METTRRFVRLPAWRPRYAPDPADHARGRLPRRAGAAPKRGKGPLRTSSERLDLVLSHLLRGEESGAEAAVRRAMIGDVSPMQLYVAVVAAGYSTGSPAGEIDAPAFGGRALDEQLGGPGRPPVAGAAAPS